MGRIAELSETGERGSMHRCRPFLWVLRRPTSALAPHDPCPRSPPRSARCPSASPRLHPAHRWRASHAGESHEGVCVYASSRTRVRSLGTFVVVNRPLFEFGMFPPSSFVTEAPPRCTIAPPIHRPPSEHASTVALPLVTWKGFVNVTATTHEGGPSRATRAVVGAALASGDR